MMERLSGKSIHSLAQLMALTMVLILTSACVVEGYSGNSGRPDKETQTTASATDETPEPTPTAVPTETRPSGAVFFDRNFCACYQTKSVILSDCAAYCAGRNDQTPTGYFTFTLGAEVTENAKLGNLQNWCTATLTSTTSSTGCYLEAKYGTETQRITGLSINGSTVSANLQSLDEDKTYILTLVEQSSDARSDSVHIRRIDPDQTTGDTQGVLKIIGANQYDCFFRSGLQDVNDAYFDYAIRKHYYYVDNNLPPSVVPGHPTIFCHDIQIYGLDDNPLYPRLNLQQSQFYLWSQSDTRFLDLNSDGVLDINKTLVDRFTEEGVVGNTQTFAKLEWFFYPQGALSTGTSNGNINDDNSQLNNSGPPTLAKMGFFMSPFVEGTNNVGFCPKQADFNGTNKLFTILKDYIGGDTEGIYLAVREPLSYSYVDANGTQQTATAPDDFLIMREGILKQVWFYTNNQGLHIVPDEQTIGNHTIRFYYPPDTANPFVKKAYQHVYTITHPNTYNGDPNAIPTSVTPNDKRFGCVPSPGP